MTRVFRDVLKYVHKNNEYIEGSLLNRSITATTTTHFIKKFNSTYPKMLRLF